MDSPDMIEKVSERHWMLINDVIKSKVIGEDRKQMLLKNLKTNFYYYLKANRAHC